MYRSLTTLGHLDDLEQAPQWRGEMIATWAWSAKRQASVFSADAICEGDCAKESSHPSKANVQRQVSDAETLVELVTEDARLNVRRPIFELVHRQLKRNAKSRLERRDLTDDAVPGGLLYDAQD